MKTHVGQREYYRCPDCQTLFSSKGSMSMHMRLHTGARPLKCPYCAMTFRTSGHRKVHIQKHQKEWQTGNNGQDNVDPISTTGDDDKECSRSISEGGNDARVSLADGEALLPTQEGGMMSLQLPMSIGLDGTTLLDLPGVSLDDSVITHLRAIGASAASGADHDPDDSSISVNPNIIMAQPRTLGDAGGDDPSVSESATENPGESNFEIFIENNGRFFAQNSLAGTISQSLDPNKDSPPPSAGITLLDQSVLSDVVISGVSSPVEGETGPHLKCPFCPKQCIDMTECQEHLVLTHGVLLKLGDDPPQEEEQDDQSHNAEQQVQYILPPDIKTNQLVVIKAEESETLNDESVKSLKTNHCDTRQIFDDHSDLNDHILNNQINSYSHL